MLATKPVITTPEQLRTSLGMRTGQLLENTNGAMADILSVKDGMVTLGILDTGRQINVPIANILPERPKSL